MNDEYHPESESAQDRGCNLISSLVKTHEASIEALRAFSHAGPLVPQLSVALHEYYQYQPGRQKEFQSRIEKIVNASQNQRNEDYFYLNVSGKLTISRKMIAFARTNIEKFVQGIGMGNL